jgi:hypothetical protein
MEVLFHVSLLSSLLMHWKITQGRHAVDVTDLDHQELAEQATT